MGYTENGSPIDDTDEIQELSELLENSYKQLGFYSHSIQRLQGDLSHLKKQYSDISKTIDNCLELIKQHK